MLSMRSPISNGSPILALGNSGMKKFFTRKANTDPVADTPDTWTLRMFAVQRPLAERMSMVTATGRSPSINRSMNQFFGAPLA